MESGGAIKKSDIPANNLTPSNSIPQVNKPKPAKVIERKTLTPIELGFEDQQIFVNEFENALIYFLQAGLPVFLDGLGILFPERKTKERSRPVKDKLIVHREEICTVSFEKCNELISLHRDKFPGVLETKDLAARISEKGAPFISISLTSQEVRKHLKNVISQIKKEVIETGRCSLLPNIGEFYAIHNRQGDTLTDWFAGSDIFIVAKWKKTTKSDALRVFERPVLESSFELFSAIYGSPLEEIAVNIPTILTKLGYSLDLNDPGVKVTDIKVSVYGSEAKFGKKTITFVSDGLRRIGLLNGRKGTEIVVQVVEQESDQGAIPTWPILLFGGAWVLLHSSKDNELTPGVGMSLETPALRDAVSNFTTLLVAENKKVPTEQLSLEGAFKYRTLTLLDSEEAKVSTQVTPKTLLMLLERKHFDQVIRVGRIPLTSKTALLPVH